MKIFIQNIIFRRIINFTIASSVNLIFLIIILFIVNFLLSYGLESNCFLFFILLILLSALPILNIILEKIDSAISPVSYSDLYANTINSMLNIESFEEILYKVFDSVIIIMNAGFGRIICYQNDTDIFEIQYNNNQSHKIFHREKTESDQIFLNYIKGPDDIFTKVKGDILSNKDKEITTALEKLGIDIAVPVYYNNRTFGIITIGQKKRFAEKEIKLLKIIAYKLAILSVNSYYFSQIRKKKEVEKEYELTNKIQKQFLPEPSLESGRIIIKAHHDTASSLTREFYDIFVNDALPDDIRISAYRVCGDVKETSIFMPGVQAVLQSYARLGFPPRKSIIKLKNLFKERDAFNGELMIFHSSIKQSGEFICCCSDYPLPFYYNKSSNELTCLTSKTRGSKYSKLRMKPGDIIIAACKYYYDIIYANIKKYSEIIKKNHSIPIDKIKDILVQKMNETVTVDISNKYDNEKVENEDRLLILIKMEDAH